MINFSFIKSKEARIGAIITLSIIVFIVVFNLIKSSNTNPNDLKTSNTAVTNKKLGVVHSIEHNKKSNNYIITIVFEGNSTTLNAQHKSTHDTVTITVEQHLLKSVLKNYEIPKHKQELNALINTPEKEILTEQSAPVNPSKQKNISAEPKTIKPTLIAKENIDFRVQFFMSKISIPSNDEKFSMLDEVDSYKDGEFFKYTTGKFKTFKEASELLQLISETYPEAFIVAFNKNERISVLDAKKALRRPTK